MLTMSSTRHMTEAMHSASTIALTAYTLSDGPVLRALEDAAERGARVRVRLEGFIYKDGGGVADANRGAIAALRRAGADAALAHRSQKARDPMLHLKGAIVDETLYLDDRNWRGDGEDTILRDTSPGDVRMVRDAAYGRGDPPSRSFATRKRDALASEARLIESARRGDDVIVESESFGDRNRVYAAIDAAASRGAHVRVLLSAREERRNAAERTAIERLRRDGANVAFCDADEKFALVGGARGWIGSANATIAFDRPDQLDWGARSDRPRLLAHLHERFEQRWRSG